MAHIDVHRREELYASIKTTKYMDICANLKQLPANTCVPYNVYVGNYESYEVTKRWCKMVIGQEHGWPSIKCICAIYTNEMKRIKYNKTEQNIDYEKKGWDRESI